MRNAVIVATSRVIKLMANATKLFSYLFHALWPDWRFTIPERSASLLAPRATSVIPRTVWQTNFTASVTLPVYLNYLFNRLMSPRHEFRFMTTEARMRFVRDCYPEILPSYRRLQIGAAQADLWRLLVLHRHGGVYLDIDAHAIWPLERVIGRRREQLFVLTRRGVLSNYFIASAAGNPNLERAVQAIVRNIEEDVLTNTFDVTGPGVFNRLFDPAWLPTVSYRHACHQGNFTNEYFQYVDKPEGKWHRQQRRTPVIGDP